ncbi:hypothetical protein F5Y13DRAFT_174108 [Hypoxylon sp. FL1857]|nr:hypothetical protein F5Y13DRAFT_174108 [Hypoxylon sp. FL1857]
MRIYAYVLEQIGQHPHLGLDNANNLDIPTLTKFFEDRVDADLFTRIYGATHSAVLDLHLVFDEPNKGLAFWFIQQILVNLCIRTLPIVYSEMEMNKTTGENGTPLRWNARLSQNSPFVFNHQLRNDVAEFFNVIPTHDDFKDVELDQFPWSPYGSGTSKRRLAPSKFGSKRLASDIANKEMIITKPPPPAGPPFPSQDVSRPSRVSGDNVPDHDSDSDDTRMDIDGP